MIYSVVPGLHLLILIYNALNTWVKKKNINTVYHKTTFHATL